MGADRVVVLVLAYLALLTIAIAGVLMLALLKRVNCGLVFTALSIGYIRAVSWCCFMLGAIFVIIGLYFWAAFIVAFLAMFLSICLRVVKNVLEQAAEIKSENDLTV